MSILLKPNILADHEELPLYDTTSFSGEKLVRSHPSYIKIEDPTINVSIKIKGVNSKRIIIVLLIVNYFVENGYCPQNIHDGSFD